MTSSDDLEDQPVGTESSGPKTVLSKSEIVPIYGAADSVSYNTSALGSLQTLWNVSFTVWVRPGLWRMAGILFVFSFLIAVIVVCVVEDPASLEVSKFQSIATFLSVFVGLLLGFFMEASMGRWYACANGFMDLADSVRGLQMQCYSLGVPEERMDQILRYGVLSATILSEQLHTKADPNYGEEDVDAMWDRIASSEDPFSTITDEELSVLRYVADPPGTIWMWVTIMLGRMAQDGEIPPMASPTYGRTMNLAQGGHRGVRLVRSSVNVQPPFVYVQMLAALVHINNVINAISFGMTWGSSIGCLWQFLHPPVPGMTYTHGAKEQEVSDDSQNILVSFFFSCFGPFIYQALLEVSIAIAQPFSSLDGAIPTRRLLRGLERDLQDGKMMSRQSNLPTGWLQPHFKAPS